MLVPQIENDASKVQLARLSHVYIEHADLSKFETFALDFGLVETHRTPDGSTIYFRGYGIDPYVYVASLGKGNMPEFKGPAFVAASQTDFDKAKALPGAQLRHLSSEGAPGGGQMVTFSQADDTFFHVVYGQQESRSQEESIPSATHETQGPFNTPTEKPRKGIFQRYHPGPALVHKLGHFGYVLRFFDAELEWYTSNFSFVPSDILYPPEMPDVVILTFIHLDLGDEFSDHHCFFMSRAPTETPKTYLHHTSFEVADPDTQLLGHDWLHFLEHIGFKTTAGAMISAKHNGGGRIPQILVRSFAQPEKEMLSDAVFGQHGAGPFQLLCLVDLNADSTPEIPELDEIRKSIVANNVPPTVLHPDAIAFLYSAKPINCKTSESHRTFSPGLGSDCSSFAERLGLRTTFIILRPDFYVFATAKDTTELQECLIELKDVFC